MNATRFQKNTSYYIRISFVVAAIVLCVRAFADSTESEIDHLIEILDLKPGSAVADVGAGSGEVAIAIADRVKPGGEVYATEIEPKLLDRIRAAVRKGGIGNVIVVRGTAGGSSLPSNCCDAIFLREVYHHLTDPLMMDCSLYLALRPGGRLAIIDFEPAQLPSQKTPIGVPANRGGHGVPERIVEQELTDSGFQLVKTVAWPISPVIKHYCMLFRKPSLVVPTIWPPAP